MTCIYTGAVVHVLNYNATLICDLHQVMDVIIANEGKNKFIYGPPPRAWTHEVILGNNAYVHESKVIAAPALLWLPVRGAE